MRRRISAYFGLYFSKLGLPGSDGFNTKCCDPIALNASIAAAILCLYVIPSFGAVAGAVAAPSSASIAASSSAAAWDAASSSATSASWSPSTSTSLPSSSSISNSLSGNGRGTDSGNTKLHAARLLKR